MNAYPNANPAPRKNGNKKLIRAGVIAAVAIVLALIVYGGCTAIVPTGYTGILTTFGKVADYTLDAGFHLKSPFQVVTVMDNREQKTSYNTQAFSSDIQQVQVIGSINYNINKTTAMNLFKDVGTNYYNTLVSPRLLENLKAVFSKYTAEELISSRDRLSIETREMLSREMSGYGINIISVSIEDIDFADAFTDAVEAKQVAQQGKLKAEIEQEQATMEAQQQAERKKIAAEAEANVQKINADAEAYAIRAQAEAQAEANRQIAQSLTPELIEYTQVSSWDGKLPTYMAGGDSTTLPVLNLSDQSRPFSPTQKRQGSSLPRRFIDISLSQCRLLPRRSPESHPSAHPVEHSSSILYRLQQGYTSPDPIFAVHWGADTAWRKPVRCPQLQNPPWSGQNPPSAWPCPAPLHDPEQYPAGPHRRCAKSHHHSVLRPP